MNQYIISRNLSNLRKNLKVVYETKYNESMDLNNVFSELEDIDKASLIFNDTISNQSIKELQSVINHLGNQTVIVTTFNFIQINENILFEILNLIGSTRRINLFNIENGKLVVEFLSNKQIQSNMQHNEHVLKMINKEIHNQYQKPLYNEKKLMQELVRLKEDYEELYEKYLNTHQRMQYAFRELHKFKRSAWTYKRKYLQYELILSNLDRINIYKSKITKKNLKKMLKVILKKVK
ncbi:hypothetical protein [Staphylococcus felis]|uniref:Uncharacterized protein n=1 Tax=Staphylococcus felis TaxID=46127 RepID=A0A3E0IRT6_9STAP|nr:hypothetical protein [Staphylococcus felis]REH86741.1 hypothetical protein DOS61_02020 [Staphylococcus felis]REH99287.1 hypothetical protein DOS83_02555 [Staphylococcus felis]